MTIQFPATEANAVKDSCLDSEDYSGSACDRHSLSGNPAINMHTK